MLSLAARSASTAAAIALMAIPDLAGYPNPSRTVHLVIGPLAAAASIVAIWPFVRDLRLANVLFGGVLIATALVTGTFTARIAGGVIGVLLILLALPRGEVEKRFGGGWRAVLEPERLDPPPHTTTPEDSSMAETNDASVGTTSAAADPNSSPGASPMTVADNTPGPVHRRPVAVVTGGSAGIGRAVVRALADRGYDVGILARGEERLDDAAGEVAARGGRALAIECDVADAEAVEAAAERIERELGPIEAWVNNAMTSVFAPVWDTKPEEFRRVTEVTYLGYVHGTLAALRRMRPRNRGTIVEVGSALAYRSIPLQSAYCAAKHAVVGFTDSLRSELIHENSNVKVTAVHLPAVNTPQFRWVRSKLPRRSQPVPPIFQPEVAATAIVYAIENPRRELLVGWPTVLGILGHKLMPGWMDRYMANNAWSGQMIDEPATPRPDNLHEPVPGHQGAHGVFDDRARDWSPMLWANLNRGLIAALGAATAAALALGVAGLATGGRRTR